MPDMREQVHIDVAYAAGAPNPLFWEAVPAYSHVYSLDISGHPREGAEVRFAWNEQGFYVQAVLEDSFVVAIDRRDEELHFKTGDVFELFLKPLHETYYWEMYATPFGNKSTLFFPCEREGMGVDDFLRAHRYHALEVSAELTSCGWTTQLFVPATQLTALGAEWGAAFEWSVLCGRYNYTNEKLADPELSMWPPLSATNYHLTAEYAILDFNRAE